MAKKKPKKSDKPPAKKDRDGSRSGKAGSSAARGQGQELPEPRVALQQVDTLVTLVRGLVRRLDRIDRALAEPLPAPAPTPPSPHDATFAALPEFMAEMRACVCRIERRQDQPEQDQQLDAPASVMVLRRFFAGACKTLGITQPTPAIIGRVMHDSAIFTPNDDKAPRRLLELIYAKRNIPDHLSPEIRRLLERYENRANESNAESTAAASTSGRQQLDASTGRASSRVAKGIGREFDDRFDLIVNTGCGRKDPVQNGGRTNYHRYLTTSGSELFDRWPEWTDATGGTGLADERAESTQSQPDRIGSDGGATQPAT